MAVIGLLCPVVAQGGSWNGKDLRFVWWLGMFVG